MTDDPPPRDQPFVFSRPHLHTYLQAFTESRWPHTPSDEHIDEMRRALAADETERSTE